MSTNSANVNTRFKPALTRQVLANVQTSPKVPVSSELVKIASAICDKANRLAEWAQNKPNCICNSQNSSTQDEPEFPKTRDYPLLFNDLYNRLTNINNYLNAVNEILDRG